MFSIWMVDDSSMVRVAADWTSGSETSDPHARQNLEWSGTGVLQLTQIVVGEVLSQFPATYEGRGIWKREWVTLREPGARY